MFSAMVYAVAAVLSGRLDKYACNVMVRVSLCVASWVQVLVSFISVIEVNGVSAVHAPQLCPRAAIGRVSVCVASWLHVLVSTPAVVQVGAVVCVQLPQSCPSAGIVRVVVVVPSWVQVPVSTPVVVQVAGVVTAQLPKSCPSAGITFNVSTIPQILHFLLPLPSVVQVGGVPVNCSQSCAVGSMGTARVLAVVPSCSQVEVSTPSSEQVGSFVTRQFSNKCPSLGRTLNLPPSGVHKDKREIQ